MTIDDIAKDVGIGKGTIYLHYDSKEDLVISHIDRIIYRLRGKLFAVAPSDKPFKERIRQMLVTRVLFRFDSVQHYTESLNDLLIAIRPALLKQRERYFEEEAQIFAEVLREAERTGELALEDSLATAYALLAATNSFLPYDLSVKELGGRKEIEKKVLAVADLLLNGLVKNS